MSRTRKDRPHWVMENDPKVPRREERHNHVVIAETYIGYDEVEEDHWWYGKRITKIHKYHRESVPVECSIDKPEVPGSQYKYPRWGNRVNPEDIDNLKTCFHVVHYYPNGYGSKTFQRVTHSSQRAMVRDRLNKLKKYNDSWYDTHEWLNDIYRNVEPDLGLTLEDDWESQGIDWDLVDIPTKNKYTAKGWWD